MFIECLFRLDKSLDFMHCKKGTISLFGLKKIPRDSNLEITTIYLMNSIQIILFNCKN